MAAKKKKAGQAKTPSKTSKKAAAAALDQAAAQFPIRWGNPPRRSPLHTRARYLVELETYVAKIFKRDSKLKSAVYAFAQYYADEATDAVHSQILFSEQSAPLWPHHCRWGESSRSETSTLVFDRGEKCSSCRKSSTWFPFDSNGKGIIAFQACCLEGQFEGGGDYTPYAIVRRTKTGGVETEIFGTPSRAWLDADDATCEAGWEVEDYEEEDDDDDDEMEPYDDGFPVAREPTKSRVIDKDTARLLALVHDKPDDDGPRAVLADHLLQKNEKDPLGEYITLSLAHTASLTKKKKKEKDTTTMSTRIRALEGENVVAWLGPVFDVAAPESIRFDRGFANSVSVHIRDAKEKKRVLAAPEWGAVEEIWFLPQSEIGFSPMMKSLRAVGGLDNKALATLAKELSKPQLDRIQRLAVELTGKKAFDALLKMKLPALRVLAIQGDDSTTSEETNPFNESESYAVSRNTPGSADLGPKALATLASSKLFAQLDELILLSIDPKAIKAWTERSADKRPTALTFSLPSATGEAWGLRVRIVGNQATIDIPKLGDGLDHLAEIVSALPSSMKITFVGTKWFAPTKKELERLKTASKRTVTLTAS